MGAVILPAKNPQHGLIKMMAAISFIWWLLVNWGKD